MTGKKIFVIIAAILLVSHSVVLGNLVLFVLGLGAPVMLQLYVNRRNRSKDLR